MTHSPLSDNAPVFVCRPCHGPDETAVCMAIRFEVFVDEQRVPADEEPDQYDADALHLIATDAHGNAAGTARLMTKPNGVAKIGRVAVRRPYRGAGVGKALMLAVLETARERGLTHAVLDAQVPVIGFYEKLGFQAEGPVFDDAGIPHRTMRRPLLAGENE